MNNLVLKNPKRVVEKEQRANWYNYYAGFSHTFVRDILVALDLDKHSVILDPWNGAGSSTLAAALEGIRSIGVDLNPVMAIIANAKLASKNDIELAIKKVKRLRVNCLPYNKIEENDYLLHWFSPGTALYLRYTSRFILQLRDNCLDSVQDCVIFLSIFNVVRELISKFIPSNPMWVKKAKSEECKITVSNKDIKEKILYFLNDTSSNLLVDDLKGIVSLHCASSTNLPIENKSIDAIITSPPYCTRIDYGIATSPELSILFGQKPDLINSVRRSLIGRTTIDKNNKENFSYGNIADSFLEKILKHNSHASSTYYYKNFSQYFFDMGVSISEIYRVLKHGGYFVCVVQDSYYKEIHCDLAGVMVEMSKDNGMELVLRKDFDAKAVMANIHSGTKKYRLNIKAKESVLIFKSYGEGDGI